MVNLGGFSKFYHFSFYFENICGVGSKEVRLISNLSFVVRELIMIYRFLYTKRVNFVVQARNCMRVRLVTLRIYQKDFDMLVGWSLL